MLAIKTLWRVANAILIGIPILLIAFAVWTFAQLVTSRTQQNKHSPRPEPERVDCPIHGLQGVVNFECKDSKVGTWKIGPFCFRCHAEANRYLITTLQMNAKEPSNG